MAAALLFQSPLPNSPTVAENRLGKVSPFAGKEPRAPAVTGARSGTSMAGPDPVDFKRLAGAFGQQFQPAWYPALHHVGQQARGRAFGKQPAFGIAPAQGEKADMVAFDDPSR